MAESFRSSLDPGISERTNAPLSFFLFFIFIFLPSSRVDLFKGPRLIDPRDPGATCLDVCGINRATPGDLCSRLAGMKRAETRKSKSFRHSRVSLTPTIHRDENVAWKNRYFSTYRETDANLQKVILCFYRIIVFYTELMDSWEDIIFFLHRKL